MEAAEEVVGEPEVTVETVPDNIETGYSDGEPGFLDPVKYFLLGYFSACDFAFALLFWLFAEIPRFCGMFQISQLISLSCQEL